MRSGGALVLVASVMLGASRADAQQVTMGHKLLGMLGLEAGVQPEPGLYLGDRAFFYNADGVNDRNGNPIPAGLHLNTFVNGFGIGTTIKLPVLHTFLNLSISMPVTWVGVNTQQPEASLDRFGLSDLFVQPVKLGWRWTLVQLVLGYAFYAPTGRVEPGGIGGLGQGQWTNELQLGGAVWFDRRRTFYFTALASYALNSRKIAIDITRGQTIQVQGGLGVRLWQFIDLGLISYGAWQVTDDTGSAVPSVLRGARSTTYGVGPEVDFTIAAIRSRVTVRYAHDLSVTTGVVGQIVLVGFTWAAWPWQRA